MSGVIQPRLDETVRELIELVGVEPYSINFSLEVVAEEEIVHVFKKVGAIMIAEVSELFGDFNEIDGALVPKYWKV
jgi:hypothetical protein